MWIKNRQQLLAVLALAAIGLLVMDRMIVTPLAASWKKRSARIVELRKLIAQGELLLERGGRLREQWTSMRANTLPANLSAAENEVLKAFDRWSQKSRISVSGIKPQWKRQEEEFMLLECRADASGNMEALSRFLYEIEKDPLALRLESIEITSRDNNGQQLALAVQVSGLVLKQEEAE